MKKIENEDLEYIKKFSSINITNVCKKYKVNRGNLLNGRASKKNMKLIRRGLENEVAKLYLMDGDGNDKTTNILENRTIR